MQQLQILGFAARYHSRIWNSPIDLERRTRSPIYKFEAHASIQTSTAVTRTEMPRLETSPKLVHLHGYKRLTFVYRNAPPSTLWYGLVPQEGLEPAAPVYSDARPLTLHYASVPRRGLEPVTPTHVHVRQCALHCALGHIAALEKTLVQGHSSRQRIRKMRLPSRVQILFWN